MQRANNDQDQKGKNERTQAYSTGPMFIHKSIGTESVMCLAGRFLLCVRIFVPFQH